MGYGFNSEKVNIITLSLNSEFGRWSYFECYDAPKPEILIFDDAGTFDIDNSFNHYGYYFAFCGFPII
jgi:alpha-L-fucosidase